MGRLMSIAGALALLAGVTGCSGPSETTAPSPEASTSTVTVTATVTESADPAQAAAPSTVTETATETVTATAEATAAPELTTAPEATEAPESTTAEGSSDPEASSGTVTDGTLEYRLLEVETTDSVVAYGETEEAQGQFIIVTLNANNVSDEAVDFSGFDQQLIDDQGRTHDTSDSLIFLDNAFSYDTINPGLSKDGVLVFDIPADAEATALLLRSDLFGDGSIELPLDG